MRYRVTVRYGGRRKGYHIYEVEAGDVEGALREAAAGLPEEIRGDADLVEVRPSVDPDSREYVGDDRNE